MSDSTCTIPGCNSQHVARGFCAKHYKRWSAHGNPETVLTGKGVRFLESISSTKTDDCIEWPFPLRTGGYGAIWFNKRQDQAHRVSLYLSVGHAPEGMQAAHICGNRKCVNPRHLRWATPKENNQDKRAHGTYQEGQKNPRAILNEEDVRQIRELIDAGMKQKDIATKYGVARPTITGISCGRSWRSVQ